MMNTIQIEAFLRKHPNTKTIFRGVFPSDKLPKKIIKPAIIIANTDSSLQSGRHWVAFFIQNKNKGEFFDSYGRYPQKKEFLNFLRRNCNEFVYNQRQIQGFFSDTCGHYCLIYSLFRSKNKNLNVFLNEFSKGNFNSNDKKIVKMYKHNLRLITKNKRKLKKKY